MEKITNRLFALFFFVIILLWVAWAPVRDEVMNKSANAVGYPLSILWVSTSSVNFINFFSFFLLIICFGLLYEFYKPSLNFEWDKNKKWKATGIFLIIIIATTVIIVESFWKPSDPNYSILGTRTFEYPAGQIHVWPNALWEFLSIFCMETVSLSLLFGILFMTKSTPQKSKSYKIMLIGAIALELFIFIAFYLKFFITGQGESIYSGYTRIKLLQQYWFHWDFWAEFVIFIGAIWLFLKDKNTKERVGLMQLRKLFKDLNKLMIIICLFVIFFVGFPLVVKDINKTAGLIVSGIALILILFGYRRIMREHAKPPQKK